MPGSLRHLYRLIGIARTLGRHDALFLAEKLPLPPALRWGLRRVAGRGGEAAGKRPGERLAAALLTLGPSFIKLGQAMSVRPDLVGDDIADDLTALQDRLEPFPGAQARAAIAEEFGRPAEELFSEFNDQAVAAASIAQVHFAVTTEGDAVAVKVLRPGIEAAFARDVALFRWIAGLIARNHPEARRLKPVEVVETFARTVQAEMDLRFEAAAGEELGRNFADDPAFRVPAMDWSRTGQRVLTTERVSGFTLDEGEALRAAGHDTEAVIANMARCFFLQVVRDGFFHADLHPGNLFVGEDGAIVAVDFGIMGRIDKPTRQFLAEMLAGFLSGDYRAVADVHIRAGYLPADQSADGFAQAARSIAEPIMGLPLNQISLARLLAQLFAITRRFEMETQPQLLLLQKTMMVAEGVGRNLHPQANMWELARPLIADWMEQAMAPETLVRDTVADLASRLQGLPRIVAGLGKTAENLAKGEIKLHPDTVAALTASRRNGAGRWLPWGLVALLAALLLAWI